MTSASDTSPTASALPAAPRREMTFDQFAALIGQDLGVSSWIKIDQARINDFARISGDYGFIHVDPEAAAKTRFGGAIAHGLLTLALTGAMAAEVLPQISDRAFLMNYGYDRIRMLSPVPAGSWVRGRYALTATEVRAPKDRLARLQLTVEIKDAARPALVAESLLLVTLR